MKGFTLIEIVIVILIIGILGGISIPKYIDLQDSAQQAACDGNATAVTGAVSLYYAQAAVNGNAAFPATLTADLFAGNVLPPTSVGFYSWTYSSGNGAVTTNF